MKYILLFLLLLPLNSFAQIKDCRIVYLDSNHIKHINNNVTLEFFRSDTLTFSDLSVTKRINITHLKMLNFKGGSSSPKGFLIGAGVGFTVVLIAAIIIGQSGGIGGGGHPGDGIGSGIAILGSLLLGVPIGGMIGGAIEGSHKELKTFDFSDLSISQARRQLKEIFQIYNKKKE